MVDVMKLSFATFWADMQADFYQNFIEDDRWKLLLRGLGVTLEIAFFAVIIGVVLGFLIAVIRSSADKLKGTGNTKTPGRIILSIVNGVCKIYLTIFRGTPVVVQLLFINFVIFASSSNKILVGCLAFGLNSAAYVAEIVRSGINSIDEGQFEAGRSLGFNYPQTMIFIILPQAFKNILPALGNEFIVLLKETSVSGYIATNDLTKGGDIIRSITWSPFMPLIAVALIYLLIVMILTKLVSMLERRLKNSER